MSRTWPGDQVPIPTLPSIANAVGLDKAVLTYPELASVEIPTLPVMFKRLTKETVPMPILVPSVPPEEMAPVAPPLLYCNCGLEPAGVAVAVTFNVVEAIQVP